MLKRCLRDRKTALGLLLFQSNNPLLRGPNSPAPFIVRYGSNSCEIPSQEDYGAATTIVEWDQ